MADGAARSHSYLEDTSMAEADRIIYEAVFSRFYGDINLTFKAGKLVLIRKSETVIPTSALTNGRTDGGEAISGEFRDGSHIRNGVRDPR